MKFTWSQLGEWFFMGVGIGYVIHLAIEAFQVSQPTIHEAVQQMLAK